MEGEPIREKASELLPDRQNPIGGQGGCGAHGIEKACRRETVLSSDCIDWRGLEVMAPSGLSGASPKTENTQRLPGRQRCDGKIGYPPGGTIASAFHEHAAIQAQPRPASRPPTRESQGCPDAPLPTRHKSPSVPSGCIPTAGAMPLSRHSPCIGGRESTGWVIEKRCSGAYRRENGQQECALS